MIAFFSQMINFFWFFKPFEGRFIHLAHAYQGYLKTGVPWIEFFDGKMHPFCALDDPGIYWIIPRLANFMPCSLETTITFFFYGIICISFLGGLVGFFALCKSLGERIVVIVGITALFLLTVRVGDVYIFYSCVPVLCIPWAQWLFVRHRSMAILIMMGLVFGFFLTCAHLMRAYSSVATIFAIICLCLGARSIDKKNKIIFLSAVLIGASLIWSMYRLEQKKYQEFTVSQGLESIKPEHLLWHAVYCGFGFLKFMNPDKIVFDDACAERKAAELKKKYPEKSYEELLRNEVFRLVREERFFIIQTIFAKIGVLILFLLIAMNFGIIAAWVLRKPFYVDCSYAGGLVCSALFPLITMPFLTYSLGFIALGVLWGIESINYAISILVKTRSKIYKQSSILSIEH